MRSIVQLAYKQGQTIPSSVVNLAYSTNFKTPVSGSIVQIAYAQAGVVSGSIVKLAYEQRAPHKRKRFAGSQAIGVGDYDLRARIGGIEIDICRLMDTVEISHAENQAYICDMVMREDIGEVDVYKWHGKPIEVEIVHDGGIMRVYQGIVDISKFNLPYGKRLISCSDRRKLMINSLPRSVIEAVGYTSKSAHGEFKDQFDEMSKRLETVPASFEFDANGTGYLTAWQPKAIPDRLIGNCVVYKREPRVEMAAVGRVVNKVHITVDNQFTRHLQRDRSYSFQSGYWVCQYQWWGMPPPVAGIKSAIEGAGWAMSNFMMDGLAKEGIYTCGFNQKIWWSPINRKINNVTNKKDPTGKDYTDTNGNPIRDSTSVTVTDYTMMYATNASWDASKRWKQNVDEKYSMTLQNAASIGRYGEIIEEVSYGVKHEYESDWGENYKTAQPAPKGFIKMGNGDWYQDINNTNQGDFEATMRVAWHTAYTKMLASHRENTLQLEIKFLPELDLRHTHRIEHVNFTGNVKVSSFKHTFIIGSLVGQTEITYKFYQNAADNGTITPFFMPARPANREAVVDKKVIELGVHNFMLGEEVKTDGISGFVTKTTHNAFPSTDPSYRTPEQRQGVAFVVHTPDIEKFSTDTLELEQKQAVEVNIPNNEAVIRIV